MPATVTPDYEDVQVGGELPSMRKGPLTTMHLMRWSSSAWCRRWEISIIPKKQKIIWRGAFPVFTPSHQVRPAQFLKNQTAENQMRFVNIGTKIRDEVAVAIKAAQRFGHR